MFSDLDFPMYSCFKPATAVLTKVFRYGGRSGVLTVVAHRHEAFGLGTGAFGASGHSVASQSPMEKR